MIEDNVKAENNSFLYFLHERNHFDTGAFAKLLDAIDAMEEKQEDVLEQLRFIQIEILKHIIYHFDPEDESCITNLPDDYWKYMTDLEDAIGKYAGMRAGSSRK